MGRKRGRDGEGREAGVREGAFVDDRDMQHLAGGKGRWVVFQNDKTVTRKGISTMESSVEAVTR